MVGRLAVLLALALPLAMPGAARAAEPPAGWLPSGPVYGGEVDRVVVDPERPAHALAVVVRDLLAPDGSRLYETTDGGVTWTTGPSAIEGESVATLRLLTMAGGSIWATTFGGKLCRSDRVDAAFTCVAASPVPTSLVAVPGSPAVLLRADGTAVQRSIDAGVTWTAVTAPSGELVPEDLVVADPTAAGAVYGRWGSRLLRSVDGGLHWSFGPQQPCASGALVVDPSTPGRLYGVNGNLLCRSIDAGTTWQDVPWPAARDAAAANVPPAVTGAGVLLVPRGTDLWRSLDAGATWTRAGDVDRRNVNVVASAGEAIYAGTATRGVFTSADGGASFGHASAGLVPRSVNDAALVLQRGSDVLYGLQDRDVLRSADGGATWQVRWGNDLATGDVVAELLGVDPVDGTLYARLSPGDGSGPGAFARSTDGGRSFAVVARGGIFNTGVPRFVIAPADRRVLLVLDDAGRLQASRDGGSTWRRLRVGTQITDVAADAGDAARLYAAARVPGGQLGYVSANGGRKWRRAIGQPGDWKLAADPVRPGIVVAFTGGGLRVSTDGGRHFRAQPLGLDIVESTPAFQGTFAGGALVAPALLPKGPRPGTIAAIPRGGGLAASPDLGRSWTWLPASLPASDIESVEVSSSGLLVVGRGGVWRAPPLPPLARLTRPPRILGRTVAGGILRCVPASFAGGSAPTTTISADGAPAVLGRPPFRVRRATPYGFACRTVARTPQGIALATSRAIPGSAVRPGPPGGEDG